MQRSTIVMYKILPLPINEMSDTFRNDFETSLKVPKRIAKQGLQLVWESLKMKIDYAYLNYKECGNICVPDILPEF